MARLRKQSPAPVIDYSGDSEFAEQRQARGVGLTAEAAHPILRARSSPRKQTARSYRLPDDSGSESEPNLPELKLKSASKSPLSNKQIRLAPLRQNLGTVSLQSLQTQDRGRLRHDIAHDISNSSPDKRKAPERPREIAIALRRAKCIDAGRCVAQIEVEVEVEESICCGSGTPSDGSDDELPSPRKLLQLPRKATNRQSRTSIQHHLNDNVPAPSFRIYENPFCPSQRPGNAPKQAAVSSRPVSSSDKENSAAFLSFSPPRLHSPAKTCTPRRPVTPPQPPSKSRLQSPSKTKFKVPAQPLRPSLDAFWDADTVNDWNEQYSPKKVLQSPKKLRLLREDASASPTSSPRKARSPTKAEREAKKDFESRKRSVAAKFFGDLDSKVTKGRVGELAASTGGVHFIWSKSLNSTAGRANWRRETIKTRELDGTTTVTYRDHASIELAEKVINDEHRLLNVIAHEFCHLANFMVSGVKDQPHGRQFKDWGRKCTTAFADQGVEVTTKHNYEIEYKYIWQCSNENCGSEFKRHSKSIDPKRHTCGSCRSKLDQIKPVPRKDAGSENGYAAYVKTHFAAVKRSMPKASQKAVMEAVARKYREHKASVTVEKEQRNVVESVDAAVDNVASVLEYIILDDD